MEREWTRKELLGVVARLTESAKRQTYKNARIFSDQAEQLQAVSALLEADDAEITRLRARVEELAVALCALMVRTAAYESSGHRLAPAVRDLDEFKRARAVLYGNEVK